jgi:hypothetical protein
VSCEPGSLTDFVQVKGRPRSFPAVDEVLDGGDEVLTEMKLPQRMACRVIEKKTFTMLSQDPRCRREGSWHQPAQNND